MAVMPFALIPYFALCTMLYSQWFDNVRCSQNQKTSTSKLTKDFKYDYHRLLLWLRLLVAMSLSCCYNFLLFQFLSSLVTPVFWFYVHF